jgi:hypothetical protein
MKTYIRNGSTFMTKWATSISEPVRVTPLGETAKLSAILSGANAAL